MVKVVRYCAISLHLKNQTSDWISDDNDNSSVLFVQCPNN